MELNIELKRIKLDKIKEHELNPRKTIERAYKRLVDDIADGIDKDLIKSAIWVVELEDGTYRVMDGHHRLRAMQELGLEECPAMVIPEKDYDEGEQLADLITMNKQVASFDTYRVGEVLEKLQQIGWDNELIEKKMGYDSGEVGKLLDLTKVNFDALEKKRSEKDDAREKKKEEQAERDNNESGRESIIFNLTETEIMLVDQAISKMLDIEPNISRGRALELICAEFEA